MTPQQWCAFGILGGAMVLFIWGRVRYDIVALLALLASVAVGTVPKEKAFLGFADDIVIIVGSALVISAAVSRSGIIETALKWIGPRVAKTCWQLAVLVSSVTFLSAIVKNIGALAMLMPAAIKMAGRAETTPSRYLMPMAFGSLLGGLITLVGTSPNIIVSRVREEMTGQPFRMFDYTPVGLSLSLLGLVFLFFAYRIIPKERRGPVSMGEALNIGDYTTQAEVLETSEVIGKTAVDFQAAHEDVEVSGVLRGAEKKETPVGKAVFEAGDTILLIGPPESLERAIAKEGLVLEGQHRAAVAETPRSEIGVIEAVVYTGSPLIGRSAGRINLHEVFGVNLLAISRSGHRLTSDLARTRLRAGDIVVFQGPLEQLPGQLSELGCLPLAERAIHLGDVRRAVIPLTVLAAAMAATATGAVPVAFAFLGAAVLLILLGSIPAREAYKHVEWPILIMLGALIPVSEAIQTSGGTELISNWLSSVAKGLPAYGAVGLILVAAMLATPFLNNAATVLVMGPIAATFAKDLQMRPEPFLMAVAVGAGCDFLTPIGHQCNTLVLGPGGYKFGDYARLGAPLSLLVIFTGVPLILHFWPA